MKPDVKRILTKLSENNNVKGLHKINLSKINEIEEQIGIGQSGLEFFEDKFADAQRAFMEARDVLKFDTDDAVTYADELLQDVLQDIKELGVDIPPKVKQAQKEVQDLETQIKDGLRRLDSF